jgi:hypothetical protein
MSTKAISAIVSELQQKVRLKIRFGESRERILYDSVRLYGEELGPDEVKSAVEEIIDTFGDYHLIQMIMRSKIVREIDGKDSLILDPVSKTATKITSERLREVLHKKLDISNKIYTCIFKYDPYSLKQLYQTPDGLWIYNQYRPPFWQEEAFFSGNIDLIEDIAVIPDMYKKFLMHLVNNDSLSYEYILDWLANSIQRRNFCILTTIGSQGIGKGTLGEIMRSLVGDDNYTETGNRILAERFNAQIKNKRIVYCDEASVKSQKEEERLKALVNNALEVEAKGKDAERITNFASFYFSSNSIDAIKLTADDRRFSIVNLTDKKLLEEFSVEEIKNLTKKENIDKLARYLYFREVDENSMLRVFNSAKTEEIRAATLASWHDWFLDEYAIDNAGKTIKLDTVSNAVEDKYGTKFKPGKKAFMELEKIYPKKFHVFKPRIDDKQVWAIRFPDLEAQPKSPELKKELRETDRKQETVQ